MTAGDKQHSCRTLLPNQSLLSFLLHLTNTVCYSVGHVWTTLGSLYIMFHRSCFDLLPTSCHSFTYFFLLFFRITSFFIYRFFLYLLETLELEFNLTAFWNYGCPLCLLRLIPVWTDQLSLLEFNCSIFILVWRTRRFFLSVCLCLFLVNVHNIAFFSLTQPRGNNSQQWEGRRNLNV